MKETTSIGEASDYVEPPTITRKRKKSDPEELKERDRQRKRVSNMPVHQAEAQRERDRNRNLHPARLAQKRAYERKRNRPRDRIWRRKLNKTDKIVAWDGEGLEEDLGYISYADPFKAVPEGNRHRYVILQDSEGSEIRDRKGLGTKQILDTIWNTHSLNPQAWHVGYGLDYDYNNWLKDVTKETAQDIYDGKRVKLGDYAVRFPGLWFELEKDNQRVVIWDVWRFWQFGFEKALEKTLPDYDPVDMEIIRKGKSRRADRQWSEIEDMAIYNRAELKALVKLTQTLAVLLEQAGIPMPSFLTGAGALAGSLMRKYGVQHHNAPLPEDVEDAVMRAFAAGRIEPWMIGHTDDPLHSADIRSAYPDAQRWLPSFQNSTWEKIEELKDDWESRFSVYHVRWDWVGRDKPASRRYFPFHYRKEDGTIYFPPAGEGWVWWPEVKVAQQLGWKFEIVEGWKLKIGNKHRPFAFQEKMYEFRKTLRDLGLEGAVQELKLAMNACYGKTCQARGSVKTKPPALTNFAWAGWTTSWTRAKLMEASNQNPEAVVYQTTDCICSTAEFDVDEGPGLGQWEKEVWPNGGTVVQAGIAFLHNDELKYPDNLKVKVRGFNKREFEEHAEEWEQAIINTWKHDGGIQQPDDGLEVPTKRPITLGSALQGDRFEKWNQWETVPRKMNLYGGGGKRLWTNSKRKRPWKRMEPLVPARGLVPLKGLELLGESMSARHKPDWADVDYSNMEPIEGELLELKMMEAGENA